jgi:hypothetical protein
MRNYMKGWIGSLVLLTNISMCDFLLKTDLYEGKDRSVLTLKTPDGKIKKVPINKK